MGYTHYFKLSRRFTNSEWAEITDDLETIVSQATAEGIELGDWSGETHLPAPSACRVNCAETGPAWGFNGFGEDRLETFAISQERAPLQPWQKPKDRGREYCKTGRNAYDVAVIACLIYLDSRFPEKFGADSDGKPADWQDGLELARRALPRLGNVLRIPAVIEFDALFSRVHVRGGKYAIASTTAGELCLIDDSRLAIVGRFTTAVAHEWATAWVRRVAEERQRKMPWDCDALDRWEARKLRTFREAAETFEYLTPEPVEA